VRKVVSIAAPFRGSIEAIKKLITGTGSTRETGSPRLTPSLYYLLPSFSAGIDIDPALPQSLFDIDVWQEQRARTIKEALRIYGTNSVSSLDSQATAILGELLNAAETSSRIS